MQQNKVLIMIMISALFCLILSMLSISTIISLFLFNFCLIKLVQNNWKQIQQKGLLQYLPKKLQNLLLNRSIFDLMCDIWFLQRISHIIKIIIAPVIYKLEPQDFNDYLKDNLKIDQYEMITTKGLINLAPIKFKKILGTNKKYQNKIIRSISNLNMYKASDFIFDNSTESINSNQSKNQSQKPVTRNKSCLKLFVTDKQKSDIDIIKPKADQIQKIRQENDQQDTQKNIDISQLNQQSQHFSQKIDKIRDQLKIWDRSDIYKQLKIDKSKIQNKYQLKLQMINKLFQLKNFVATSYQVLIKNFLYGAFALILQLSISEKSRKFMKNIITILFYTVSLILSSTSLGLIGYKIFHKFQQNKIKK